CPEATRPTSALPSPNSMKVVAPPKSCPRAVSARAAAQGTGRALGVGRQALQPAPYPRVVAAIDVPELALEIGFLAGDHIVADYKRRHAPQERRRSYSAIVSHDMGGVGKLISAPRPKVDLDQLVLQGRQRPVLDRLRRRQRAQEIAEVVGER